MGAVASQITSLTIVYSTIYSNADKKTPKLRVTGLCAGKSPGTGEFSAQMASNAENVSMTSSCDVRMYLIILKCYIWYTCLRMLAKSHVM